MVWLGRSIEKSLSLFTFLAQRIYHSATPAAAIVHAPINTCFLVGIYFFQDCSCSCAAESERALTVTKRVRISDLFILFALIFKFHSVCIFKSYFGAIRYLKRIGKRDVH